MNGTFTKTDELAALDTFIASLPRDSYVRDILTDGRDAIERDIRSDLCCGTLAELSNARQEVQQALANLREQRKAIEREKFTLQRHIIALEGRLRDLQSDARNIVTTLCGGAK